MYVDYSNPTKNKNNQITSIRLTAPHINNNNAMRRRDTLCDWCDVDDDDTRAASSLVVVVLRADCVSTLYGIFSFWNKPRKLPERRDR